MPAPLPPSPDYLPRIHLINPMWDSSGAEWRTYELFRLLQPHARVTLWSQATPSPTFTSLAPIRRIRPGRLQFPWTGTLVFVGIYARIDRWIHLARPRRIIFVYNTEDPRLLALHLRRARLTHRIPIEVVYASAWLRDSVGGCGPVHVSTIDLERFASTGPRSKGGAFIVGRHSRDIAPKHHAGDPAFYRRLAASGMQVRVLGGTVLAPTVGSALGIELFPADGLRPEAFLRDLDCFYYRTSAGFREPHGRVVQEAMACGLPVVCHRSGGYADFIDHGRNGFLFDTEDEAFSLLTALRNDPGLRIRVGAAARATVAELFSPSALRRVAEFYLVPDAPLPAPRAHSITGP